MALDREKLRSLVQYICWSCESFRLGKVKLHKTLWYADLNSFLEAGQTLTGETYTKARYGPVASHLDEAIRSLGDAVRVSRGGTTDSMWEFETTREPNVEWLTPDQQRIVDAAIQLVCYENTATSISMRTHDRIWEIASTGEKIPPSTALVSELAEPTEEDIEWAKRVDSETR